MLTCTYDFYCCKQEPPLKLPGNRSQPGQFTTTESRLKDKAYEWTETLRNTTRSQPWLFDGWLGLTNVPITLHYLPFVKLWFMRKQNPPKKQTNETRRRTVNERKDKNPPQNILTHLIINFFKYFNVSYIQNVTVNFINFAALFFPPRRLNQSSAPTVAHSSYLYLESEFSHWSPIIFSSSGLSVSSSPFYGMKNAITSQQGQPGDCRRVRRSLSFPSLINQLIST